MINDASPAVTSVCPIYNLPCRPRGIIRRTRPLVEHIERIKQCPALKAVGCPQRLWATAKNGRDGILSNTCVLNWVSAAIGENGAMSGCRFPGLEIHLYPCPIGIEAEQLPDSGVLLTAQVVRDIPRLELAHRADQVSGGTAMWSSTPRGSAGSGRPATICSTAASPTYNQAPGNPRFGRWPSTKPSTPQIEILRRLKILAANTVKWFIPTTDIFILRCQIRRPSDMRCSRRQLAALAPRCKEAC